jgi:hypothetical protein
VLWVDAGVFRPEWVRRLPGYLAILCGLSLTWIAVDGLDRVERNYRRDWEDCLRRLITVPNAVVLTTAREEVLTAGEWLQRMTSSLRPLRLEPLTIGQVRAVFRNAGFVEPVSNDLLKVLRNPFLFNGPAKG